MPKISEYSLKELHSFHQVGLIGPGAKESDTNFTNLHEEFEKFVSKGFRLALLCESPAKKC
jgi:hypothetical protein